MKLGNQDKPNTVFDILFSINKDQLGSMCSDDYDCLPITKQDFEDEYNVDCDANPEVCQGWWSPEPCPANNAAAVSAAETTPTPSYAECTDDDLYACITNEKTGVSSCKKIKNTFQNRFYYCRWDPDGSTGSDASCFYTKSACEACSYCSCNPYPAQQQCFGATCKQCEYCDAVTDSCRDCKDPVNYYDDRRDRLNCPMDRRWDELCGCKSKEECNKSPYDCKFCAYAAQGYMPYEQKFAYGHICFDCALDQYGNPWSTWTPTFPWEPTEVYPERQSQCSAACQTPKNGKCVWEIWAQWSDETQSWSYVGDPNDPFSNLHCNTEDLPWWANNEWYQREADNCWLRVYLVVLDDCRGTYPVYGRDECAFLGHEGVSIPPLPTEPVLETDCKYYKCENLDPKQTSKTCVEVPKGEPTAGAYLGLSTCRSKCENRYVCQYDYQPGPPAVVNWSCVYDPLEATYGTSYESCEEAIKRAEQNLAGIINCPRPKFDCTYEGGTFLCKESSSGQYKSLEECQMRINDNCFFRYDCPTTPGGECVPNSRNKGDFSDKNVCESLKGNCGKWSCTSNLNIAFCKQDNQSGDYSNREECEQKCCVYGGYPQNLGSCHFTFFPCEDNKTREYCDQHNGVFWCGYKCNNSNMW